MTALPQLRFNDHVLDTSPEGFGPLQPSDDALADRDELHRRLALDGYLYLPGFLDPEAVAAARKSSLERFAAKDLFQDGHPLDEARLKPSTSSNLHLSVNKLRKE